MKRRRPFTFKSVRSQPPLLLRVLLLKTTKRLLRRDKFKGRLSGLECVDMITPSSRRPPLFCLGALLQIIRGWSHRHLPACSHSSSLPLLQPSTPPALPFSNLSFFQPSTPAPFYPSSPAFHSSTLLPFHSSTLFITVTHVV